MCLHTRSGTHWETSKVRSDNKETAIEKIEVSKEIPQKVIQKNDNLPKVIVEKILPWLFK